jgi:hypothetical protein
MRITRDRIVGLLRSRGSAAIRVVRNGAVRITRAIRSSALRVALNCSGRIARATRERSFGLLNHRGAAFAMAALCFAGWAIDFATDRVGAQLAPAPVVLATAVPVSIPLGGDARREIVYDPYAPLSGIKGVFLLNGRSGAAGSIPDVDYGQGYAAVDGSVRRNGGSDPRGAARQGETDLRYIGRVSGPAPIAILQDGEQRRIVSVGDTFNHVVVMKIDERQVVLSSGRVLHFSLANDAVSAPLVPVGPAVAPIDPGTPPRQAMGQSVVPRVTGPQGAPVAPFAYPVQPPAIDPTPVPTNAPALTTTTINNLNSFFGGHP